MSENISPLAGKPVPKGQLIDVDTLVAAYHDKHPDPSVAAQRVAFGTSGHRGSSLDASFNEDHIVAITQAVCEWRSNHQIDGPLFIGIDTHALSVPAFESALEVLCANDVQVQISKGGEYTPTPSVSLAILAYNKGRKSGLADGIVVTPSHNPPDNGGFKYNTPNGGPADTEVTGWIQQRANALLEDNLRAVKRVAFKEARAADSTREYDFKGAYIDDLGNILDFDTIRGSALRLGVDPLGGAGVHYWARIAEQYRIDLTVVSEEVDPQFAFMSVDWDGRIRMDPSSNYAMQRLIGIKDRFDIAFACDTDHDRHGIVTPDSGLLPPNHYQSVMIDYLFRQREHWSKTAAVGKTVVSSAMIDRVTKRLGRKLFEVPVGFKWFVDGLFDGSLGFGGEESAGAMFLRTDGSVWTTDKDGIVPALLSAEITAREGKTPDTLYDSLEADLGTLYADRLQAPAKPAQKQKLAKLSPKQIDTEQLAGDAITDVSSTAPGNDAPIGGIRVRSDGGWFAARPSGTEDIYKIYAESFHSAEHLKHILDEAQKIVDAALN
ncbi:MAG: phosphoglucomutase (alpha-D-glucose-1,6-bisphosphate-dependent), partial [Lysobacteraceae bacterium]